MADEPEGQTDDTNGEPEAIELDPDSYIRVGDGDPVKFSEWRPEGYIRQDEWTRKTQELAEQRRQFEQEKEQQLSQLQNLYRTLQAQQQQGASQSAQQRTADAIQDLIERGNKRGGYLAPEDLQDYHQRLAQWAQGITGQHQKLQEALKLLYDQQQQVSSGVTGLSQSQAQQQAERFIAELKDAHEAFRDDTGEMLLRNLVDSYEPAEGESTQDFQNAIRAEAEKLAGKIDSFAEKRMKDKMEGARRAKSMGVPSRGGTVTPSAALKKGVNDSPEDFARAVAESGMFD